MAEIHHVMELNQSRRPAASNFSAGYPRVPGVQGVMPEVSVPCIEASDPRFCSDAS